MEREDGLAALRERLRRKRSLEALKERLWAQLSGLEAEERRLADALAKEKGDVARLERPSLAAFFYAALRRKEEKLDRERAEADEAAIRHDAALRQSRGVRSAIGKLEADLSALQGTEALYEAAFARKEAAVRVSASPSAAELFGLEERLGELRARLREVGEAMAVGEAALRQIDGIGELLGSAESWGAWDLLGGGLLADLAKHSRLDEAQEEISRLQVTLGRYRAELSDVAVSADIRAQVDGFLRLADFLFDGLFADFAVLSRIREAQDRLSGARAQVKRLQVRLEGERRGLSAEAASLDRRRAQLVLEA